MHVDEAIRTRRTHKLFAGGAIDDATLRELIDLARWAPNHEYTEPWRFLVVRHARLAAMAEAADAAFAAVAKEGAPEQLRKLTQKREKLTRRLQGTGAVVVACCAASPADPMRAREDYAATACAVHNLLLGATARGLAGLWSTGAVLQTPAMRTFYGVRDGEDVVGVVFLGTPVAALEGRRYRSVDEILAWV